MDNNQFVVGDIVCLRTGGPEMIVSIDKYSGREELIKVIWIPQVGETDGGIVLWGNLQEAFVPVGTLSLVRKQDND